jgi:hypothetical protein
MAPISPAATLAAALLVAPLGAAAAPCGAPDLLEAFPADGATAVPTNATLSAHYASTADYRDEDVKLEHVDVGSDMLTGTFDSAEGLLSVSPEEPLVPGDRYVVTWPRLHGIGTSNRGSGRRVAFEAGDVTDAAPHEFQGLTGVEWDVSRKSDECTDGLEDRFTFDLALGAASDDGGRASLALVVYQTRGPAISDRDPSVEVLLTSIPAKGAKVRVERAIGDGTGPVCFAALVRDLTGSASGGADRSVCATTTAPPFFYGCTVGRGSARGASKAGGSVACGASLLVLSLVVARTRRRFSS